MAAGGDRVCTDRVGTSIPSNRDRIVVATKPVEFRKDQDGLSAVMKGALRKDPFTGTVFIIRTKRTERSKLIYRDRTERDWR